MISERQFANGFGSFWSDLIPLLTPSCVSVFNESHAISIAGGLPVEELSGLNPTGLPMDIISEGAFKLAADSFRSGTSAAEWRETQGVAELAWAWAVERISLHRPVSEAIRIGPSNDSVAFMFALSDRYDVFRSHVIDRGEIEYEVPVAGSGFLAASVADVSVGNAVCEVKAVDRRFSAKDIRQVLVYLALDYCSGSKKWSHALLYNPRRDRLAEFEPSRFIRYISGGRSAANVFHEIESFLDGRDVVIESGF